MNVLGGYYPAAQGTDGVGHIWYSSQSNKSLRPGKREFLFLLRSSSPLLFLSYTIDVLHHVQTNSKHEHYIETHLSKYRRPSICSWGKIFRLGNCLFFCSHRRAEV